MKALRQMLWGFSYEKIKSELVWLFKGKVYYPVYPYKSLQPLPHRPSTPHVRKILELRRGIGNKIRPFTPISVFTGNLRVLFCKKSIC